MGKETGKPIQILIKLLGQCNLRALKSPKYCQNTVIKDPGWLHTLLYIQELAQKGLVCFLSQKLLTPNCQTFLMDLSKLNGINAQGIPVNVYFNA